MDPPFEEKLRVRPGRFSGVQTRAAAHLAENPVSGVGTDLVISSGNSPTATVPNTSTVA